MRHLLHSNNRVALSSCNRPDFTALTELYKLCIQTRDFEISQLSARNNFFMIFQGVLFAGVVQSEGNFPTVSFLACFAGFLTAIYQTQMASGAKFWQEHWESMTARTENELLGLIQEKPNRKIIRKLFSQTPEEIHQDVSSRMNERKTGFIIKHLTLNKYSVSQIPIFIGIAFSLIWLALLIATLNLDYITSLPKLIEGFQKP